MLRRSNERLEARRRTTSALAFAALALGLVACPRDPPPPPAAASAPVTSARAAAPSEVRFIERLTGGATESDRLPLIVAIHGLGDRPESYVAMFGDLPVKARLVMPYGLDPYGDGFSWFSVTGDRSELAAGIARAADRIAAMIAEISAAKPTRGKAIVTGFSQGGMLSFALAVRHPEVVAAAFPMGGMLPDPLWPAEWPMGRAMPIVHAFHGEVDPRVPLDSARATVGHLKAIGWPARLTVYPGVAHAISKDEQVEVTEAIEKELQSE